MNEEALNIIDFEDIGKVRFIRKPSVRNLKITIRPFKGIQVSVPQFVTLESAGKFVEEKRSWIKSTQLKLARYEKNVTWFDENSSFHTKEHILILEKHSRPTIKTVIGQGKITVIFPDFADIKDKRIQQAIKKAIIQTWKIEASRYLPERLRILALQHGLEFSKVSVRDNRTRWGSCSRDNNINLNIHLMRLPQQLSDYVMLHELSHIVHKHHQKSFWQYLNTLCGGRAKTLDTELNKYSPEVW